MDTEINSCKPTLLIFSLIERMVRVGIISFMGRHQMVADYITKKMYKNQEVSDSNPPSNVMKIVEILKQNPQLQRHDFKTFIKKVGKYFSY